MQVRQLPLLSFPSTREVAADKASVVFSNFVQAFKETTYAACKSQLRGPPKEA